MKGEISFDLIMDESTDNSVFEGCYRVLPEDWKVFYFTKWWQGTPGIIKDATFSSGIKGVNVNYGKDEVLNKQSIKKVLSEVLGVSEWEEVRGPDSLQLK
jgi:hypothetical protein